MLIPIRKNSACFPAGANGAQEAPHPVSPVSHASRYNTLHFASKVVCQRGHPFGNPGQQNRRYAALSGSIPPFVVSSPFHGLFSPFVKFGVPYYMGMLATLLHNSVQEYRLQIDDQRLSLQEYMFVVFCNGRFYGGGYQPCPDALLNDGWIDVCLIKPVPKKMIIDMAKTYEQGKHIEYPEYVSLYQAKTIGMNTENQSIYGNLDGEVRELRNPTIEVVEQALHLYLPNIE